MHVGWVETYFEEDWVEGEGGRESQEGMSLRDGRSVRTGFPGVRSQE